MVNSEARRLTSEAGSDGTVYPEQQILLTPVQAAPNPRAVFDTGIHLIIFNLSS